MHDCLFDTSWNSICSKDSENVDLEVLKNFMPYVNLNKTIMIIISSNEPNTNLRHKKKNKMWKGIIKINGKVTFIFKDGVRKPLDQCTKVGVWYYCPSGQKQRPLEGGGLDENGEREG